VPALDIIDNVLPFIGAEEEKVEFEPRKMLGALVDNEVQPAAFPISAHTNRVAVSEGHMVCASLELERRAGAEEIRKTIESFQSPKDVRGLPSAPEPPIEVRSEEDRPQPRRDRLTGKGMTAVVGRIRPDPVLDVKFVFLAHNTIRGAAGGSILNAELLVKQGYIAA
jgi:aspartate-semialdehyde dehydrogenase